MAERLFYSMGEVSEMFDVRPSLLRHWEAQFGVLRPKRNKKGNRLFSPQDVENLKLIYHLVKERGMTLDGARKALRQKQADKGVGRDAELMERLQQIRALLLEVREDLKAGEGATLADPDSGPEPVARIAEAADGVPDSAPRRRAKPVVKFPEETRPGDNAAGTTDGGDPAATAAGVAPAKRTVRKPRRKREEPEDKELFAFYEQSLF